MRSLLAGVAIAALTAAGPAAAQVELLFGHGAAPGNPRDEAAKIFAELVEERSGGTVRVSVAGNAEQGDDVEMLTALQLGTMDISANSQGPASGVVPEFAALGLPFLFAELPQAWKVLDGEVGEELSRLAEAQGFRVLAFWDNGIRHISNSARPIASPADLQGLKIRTPPDPVTLDTFSALGAQPEPLAFSELYLALEQGVFDGQENPLVNIWSSRLYEVQAYISMSGHKYESTPVLISNLTWAQLDEEQRALLVAAAREAGEWQRNAVLNSEVELIPQMEAAGIAFNQVDQEPFRTATAGIYDQWREELGDIVDRVRAAAQAAATH